jgi:hypothetical protein
MIIAIKEKRRRLERIQLFECFPCASHYTSMDYVILQTALWWLTHWSKMKVREYGWWTSYTCMKWNDETSCNCCKWGREGHEGAGKGDGRGHLNNVQCKAIWNCHNESPLYNEYILIKIGKQRNWDWEETNNVTYISQLVC